MMIYFLFYFDLIRQKNRQNLGKKNTYKKYPYNRGFKPINFAKALVLQTGALPLGYGSIYNIICNLFANINSN